MAKFCSTIALNAACTAIRDNTAKVAVCTSLITSASSVADIEGTGGSTFGLAWTSLTTGASTSWAIAAGDVSGIKLTMTSQGGVSVVSTGVAGKVVFYNTATTIIYITDCTTQALTSTNNTVTIPAFDIEFRNAT
jgi:hypothetical protein